jgi:hypothetical protein
MSTYLKGTFEAKSFDEETSEELEAGTKLTRARIVATMSGDFEGDSVTDYLMHYRSDGTASFVGFQRFAGRVKERSGSFVMQMSGGYDGTLTKATGFVVSDSGTGNLANLRGKFTSEMPHGTTGTYEFAPVD